MKHTKTPGFTLIELIIIISIFLISGLGIANFYANRFEAELSKASTETYELLTQARADAQNINIPPSCTYDTYEGHGVYFNSTTLLEFSYTCNGVRTAYTNLDLSQKYPNITVSSPNGTPFNIYFKKRSTELSSGQSMTICLTSNVISTNNIVRIVIGQYGIITVYDNQSACT